MYVCIWTSEGFELGRLSFARGGLPPEQIGDRHTHILNAYIVYVHIYTHINTHIMQHLYIGLPKRSRLCILSRTDS